MKDADHKTDQEVMDGQHREHAELEKFSPGDIELIRWSLSLSIEERLEVLQDFVDTFWTPRHG